VEGEGEYAACILHEMQGSTPRALYTTKWALKSSAHRTKKGRKRDISYGLCFLEILLGKNEDLVKVCIIANLGASKISIKSNSICSRGPLQLLKAKISQICRTQKRQILVKTVRRYFSKYPLIVFQM
jgi:hypothetical protein